MEDCLCCAQEQGPVHVQRQADGLGEPGVRGETRQVGRVRGPSCQRLHQAKKCFQSEDRWRVRVLVSGI